MWKTSDVNKRRDSSTITPHNPSLQFNSEQDLLCPSFFSLCHKTKKEFKANSSTLSSHPSIRRYLWRILGFFLYNPQLCALNFFPYVLLKMKLSVCFWRPAQKWERRAVGGRGRRGRQSVDTAFPLVNLQRLQARSVICSPWVGLCDSNYWPRRPWNWQNDRQGGVAGGKKNQATPVLIQQEKWAKN